MGEEDKAQLEERGQAALVFNQIKPALDWIMGTEKRTRVDYQILPRGEEDREGAEAKTAVVKYLDDINFIGHIRSQAFEDCVISGVGWIDTGIEENEDTGELEIYVDFEDWRNVWYDPFSRKKDQSDARFLFRAKWLDLDIATDLYPEHYWALRSEANNKNNYFDGSTLASGIGDPEETVEGYEGVDQDFSDGRPRVRLIECWYKKPEEYEVLKGDILGTFSGMRFDPDESIHQTLINTGEVEVVKRKRKVMRKMVFCGSTLLDDDVSPYHHNRFPLIPLWAFRRKKTNAPYGVVRNLRDPQSDLNKRLSKSLYILSTNKVIADWDAFEDWDEFEEEVSRPDGVMKKKPGSDVDLIRENAVADQHISLMQNDAQYIEKVSGVTDENLGRDTNATSGKAIQARQLQGHVVTAGLFDNYLLSFKLTGQILLSLIEQFYVGPRVIRILGERFKTEFLNLNEPDTESGEFKNNVTRQQADFVVDESTWNATVREAAVASLSELVSKMPPEMGIQLLDIIVDMSDVPQKDELVRRIRQINGQSDPDADQSDPEVQAEQQAKAEAAERAAQEEAAAKALEMEKLKAEIQKSFAEAKAKLAGIRFDSEKLKLERMKAIHSTIHGGNTRGKSYEISGRKGQGPYVEQGLTSNNQN